MTIEEKARAYDEALERAREALNDGTISSNAIAYLQDIFPELVESEDERIRKSIIEHLQSDIDDMSKSDCPFDFEAEIEELSKYIAWLEKQCDKDKLIQELGKYKVKYTQEILSQQLEKQAPKDKTTLNYEERERQLCNNCEAKENCSYMSRSLERKCSFQETTMYGWELGWQDAIEKACEWLKEHVCDYLDEGDAWHYPFVRTGALTDDLRKAMEEQQ